jgi:uncharacterized membrane protein HdeD (DUF308 family)
MFRLSRNQRKVCFAVSETPKKPLFELFLALGVALIVVGTPIVMRPMVALLAKTLKIERRETND